MKKVGFLFGSALIVLLVAASLSIAAAKTQTFTGEIMDSQCAGMGGHDPNGYKMTGTHTPKDCTLACVKMGGKFVLYDAANKMTYKLDNQKKPRQFAGQKVTVTGTLNKSTETIHVTSIKAAS